VSLGGKKKPIGGRLKKPKAPRGMASEKKSAKALGMSLQPGSGNYIGRKGDFENREPESYLGENKETIHGSMALKFSWLSKISREARDYRKKPFLVIDFSNVDSSHPTKWACVPLELFKQLLDATGADFEVA